MSDFPWLTVLWVVPLVGALVTAFLPKARGEVLPKQVGLLFSVLTLVVGVAIAAQFDPGDGMQLTETHDWISAFGVHYALGVDGAVNGLAAGLGGLSGRWRHWQNGFVRSYALSMFAGTLVVVLMLLLVRST